VTQFITLTELPSGLPEDVYASVTLTEEGFRRLEEFGKNAPDEVVVEFSIVGTSEDCANKVEEYVKVSGALRLGQLRAGPMFVLEVFARKITPSYRS